MTAHAPVAADAIDTRRDQVYEKLVGVMDPELGLSIVQLGLVYELHIQDGQVAIVMTLTTPACPLGNVVSREVRRAVTELPWVTAAAVRIVWEPPWSPDRMR